MQDKIFTINMQKSKKMLYKSKKCDIAVDNMTILSKVELQSPAFLLEGAEMQKHFLQDLIEPVVVKAGYELVRVMSIGQVNQTLQVMIDKKNGTDITVDDCAKVSRLLSDVLDEKDPIADKYSLEVSSPGLDRPLTKLEHFKRYIGYEIKLETEDKVENRKRFKGKITEVAGNNVVLTMEDTQYTIPFDLIAKAKLVVTDELWNEYQSAHEAVEI